jgi:hypothetical protein
MLRSSTWTLAAAALAVPLAGCGEPGNAASDTSDETSTSTTDDNNPTSGTTAEPPAPFAPIPALGGIELDWVEANQGIGVAIGRDGAGVGGGDRSSYLLQNRLTLIRAFWKELPADWVPRKIEGRLILKYPDGTEKTVSSVATVEGASFIGNLSKSFYWGLMAPEVVPGLQYRIELWETEEGFALLPEGTAAGPVAAKLPLEGNTLIGIEDSYQTLKVIVVPFNYDDGMGCKTTPDTSPETMQKFQDYMFMMNPIEKLDFTISAPIDWNDPLEDFNELNSYMSGKRAEWGVPENMYLYGLVDVCSGGLGGAGGKAYGIPTGGLKSDAWQRVSSGLSLANNVEFSSETFVHEVGHSQGRYHVYCNGQEGGPDFGYPHMNGEIGEWGFGIINFKLYHPTVHRDYMTYCHPVWASTFGWNKVYPVIKNLSSWDLEGGAAPDADDEIGSILVGSIYPDGKETWMTVRGGVDPDKLSAVDSVEFLAGGEKLAVEQAAWLPQPDGDIVNVAVPLPDDFDQVTEIVRVAEDTRTVTSKKAIWETHRALPLKSK